jgi:phosphoesterase RecJ-like protein
MNTLRSSLKLLESAHDITIVIHQKPDGDAVGSSVALQRGLNENKNATIVCVHDIPEIFKKIVGTTQVAKQLPSKCDLIVVLDCSELHRTGYSKQLQEMHQRGVQIVIIDHHQPGSLEKSCSFYVRDENSSATAEIIARCFEELRINITPEIATALLLGLYTDTGGFRHNNTSSKTFSIASRLIRYGGNLALISQTFSQSMPSSKKKLWGMLLSELRINKFGIVITKATKRHFEITKTSIEDVSGLANILALTTEARAALVLVETESGWRGTLRTRHSKIDLGRLAKLLGGKGQKKAAGFTATNTLFSGKIRKHN